MNDLAFRAATASDVAALHPLIERAYRGETARAGWTHEADLLSGGAQAVTTQEAVRDVEVVILSIPLNRIPQIAPLITCCIPCVVRPRAFALAARPLHHPDQRAAGHAGPRLSRDPARSGLNSFLLNARTAVRAAS